MTPADQLRAAAKRLREIAAAALIGADGITPVRADRADETHANLPDSIATAPEPIQATYSLADWDHNNGRPTVWDSTVPPGGLVCAVGVGPGRICGMPVESEPCPDHGGMR